jgi:hypothetical protein
MIKTLATGGRLPGFGGGDRHLSLLEAGEAVVDKWTTRAHADDLRAWGVPGFQSGGKVGQNPPAVTGRFGPIPGVGGVASSIGRAAGHVVGDIGHFFGKVYDLGKIAAAVLTGNTTAAANALNDMIGVPKGTGGALAKMMLGIPKAIVKGLVGLLSGAGGGSPSAIIAYAMQFLGQIPYVWGGTAVPGGADCCLTADAQVLTAAGPKPIIDVTAGDVVLTWEDGACMPWRVVRRSAPRRQMTYRVVTATAKLDASGNHPFLTGDRPAGWQWTEVDDLRPGDLAVRFEDGRFRSEPVLAIEPLGEADTYDITVDGTHNFIANGLVVHNSGFTQAVYRHFGINAPRTSEAQGAWVKRTGPQPGGLALYHSPAGGADPGHVALIKDAATVISQGGGMGPQLRPLRYMPLLWTGMPPGGLGAGAAGVPMSGAYGPMIQTVLRGLGLPLTLTSNWLRQIQSESGGNLNSVNRTDINAQQGHPSVGLLQLIPGTFHAYAGPYVNTPPLVNYGGGTVSLNPFAQIYAAIHYANAAYHGAAMDSVIGRGHGYANGGPINEPVAGLGAYSGALYSFGERGREWVVPEDRMGRGGPGPAGAPLIGSYSTNYYGTGDAAEAMRELAFTLRRVRQGAFFPAGA